MIPHTAITWQSQSWQQQLSNAISDGAKLRARLGLDEQAFAQRFGAADFPLRVPEHFVSLMEAGNLEDPLLLQVLPQAAEALVVPGFGRDPVGEQGGEEGIPGLLHKYHSRVLLVVTAACAIHCRYCFRRHFPYAEHRQDRAGWQRALDYIAADRSITEVILSGGDPLVANDVVLAELVANIAAIPHVQTLRIHTRLPVVLPDRIDERCLAWLSRDNLTVVMVIHSNHPRELSPELAAAMAAVRDAGVTLLNQSVLLKGVNDSLEVLVELSEKLFQMQVLPYYLHLLDRVHGAAHFEVEEAEARQLHHSLQGRLAGYLVPKLVREVAGAPSKLPVI